MSDSEEEVEYFRYKNMPHANIVIGVDHVEKMGDGDLHFIAPNGQLAGIVKDSSGDEQILCLPKEVSEDRIEVQVSNKSVLRLVRNVEVVEK